MGLVSIFILIFLPFCLYIALLHLSAVSSIRCHCFLPLYLISIFWMYANLVIFRRRYQLGVTRDPMDKALVYGTRDSEFDPQRSCVF